MKTKSLLFNASDVGCWVDGAFGADHRRDKLAHLMDVCGRPDLVEELNAEPSDDYSEEDDAIDVLQSHTEPGLVWVLEAGDLILTTEEEAS